MPVDYNLQNAASEFRARNGVGATDAIYLKSLILKLGVMAMFKPLSDNFSGMAIKRGDFRCMLINSNHRLSKQHFTIAHELYHLYIQEDFKSEVSDAGKFDKQNKVEYAADCFAAYLLMPKEGVVSLIPPLERAKNKIKLPTVVKIEQYFSCSRRAVFFRLSELGLIDFKKNEHFLTNVKQSALLLGYSGQLYEPGNHNLALTNYGVKAKSLYDIEAISESHYISLMNDIGIDINTISSEGDAE